MKCRALLAACLLAVAPVLPASAALITYDANLGNFEAIPTGSPGTGVALVTIDDVSNTMRVQVEFAGLTSGDTASHIHCCTTVAGTGTAGVATTVPTFTGFPSGVTAGTYDHTFDMSLASSYNPAFITAHGGTVSAAELVLLAGLDAGTAYLNIHTANFPGGEIRGFLQACGGPGSSKLLNPCETVPEPPINALIAMAVAAIAGLGYKRRKEA